jgi:DHA1 family multidrug resistance protein-like MFS transporter
MTPAAKENLSPCTNETSPWRSTLFVMFIAQLLSIVGFAFVLPFIPFYIREIGVTDEKLVPIWAGILMAASSLTMTIFAPFWGWLSDRYGRKLMVERAMFAGAIITMDMGIIGNVYQLLILRLLAGALTGTISASIALVSSVLPGTELGFGLGLMQVAVFLGMSLGPWIGRRDCRYCRLPFDLHCGGCYSAHRWPPCYDGGEGTIYPPFCCIIETKREYEDALCSAGFHLLDGRLFPIPLLD